MADRNPAPELMQIPGVLGWHKAGKRIHIRTTSGVTFTVRGDMRPKEMLQEADRLRTRATLLTALAGDLARMGR